MIRSLPFAHAETSSEEPVFPDDPNRASYGTVWE